MIGPSLWSAANFFLLPWGREREQTRSTLPRAGSSTLIISFPLEISLWTALSKKCFPDFFLGSFLCHPVVRFAILSPRTGSRGIGVEVDRTSRGIWDDFLITMRWIYEAHLHPIPNTIKRCWPEICTQGICLSHITDSVLLLTSHISHMYLVFTFSVQTFIYRCLYIHLTQNLVHMYVFW